MFFFSLFFVTAVIIISCYMGMSKTGLNFLGMLMYIEGMAVGIFLSLMSQNSGVTCLIFLVLVVCETAWGICVLVSLVRLKGNDLVRSFESSVF